MQISLRVRLDDTTDRILIELEPIAGSQTKDFPVEYCKEPGQLHIAPDGYLVGVSLPGLKMFFDNLAGRPDKGKKP